MRCIIAITLLPACLGGCASGIYDSRYRYEPRPIDVAMVTPDAPQQPKVRALATIVGLRRAADDQPASMDVRLMLDNLSDVSVHFDPHSVALFDATIQPLPSPAVQPAAPTTIAPHQSLTVEANFPLLDRDAFDLDGLNLRWSVTIGPAILTHSTTFTRQIEPRAYYPDPWYGSPYWSFGYRYWSNPSYRTWHHPRRH